MIKCQYVSHTDIFFVILPEYFSLKILNITIKQYYTITYTVTKSGELLSSFLLWHRK